MSEISKKVTKNMKTFKDYVQIREHDDIPTLLGNDDTKSGKLFKIIRIAWKSHQQDTLAFIRKLSKLDPEIANEYESLMSASDVDIDTTPIKKKRDSDVLSPAMADTAASGVEDV